MRLHRFYIQQQLSSGSELVVEDEHIHQWLSVFRFKTGDRIILFNGDGQEYQATFVELHKKKAVLTIGETHGSLVLTAHVHLYMAVIKKDLFELVVEKVAELGVASVTPIITERVQAKNLNFDRLQKIAIEASEQSGRGDVPEIKESVSFEEALTSAPGQIILCDMNSPSFAEAATAGKEVSIFIGPEGGWSPIDREVLDMHSVDRVSLAATVLRAETAAIVAVARFTK